MNGVRAFVPLALVGILLVPSGIPDTPAAAAAQPAPLGITDAVPAKHLGKLNNGARLWRTTGRRAGQAFTAGDLRLTDQNQSALAHVFIGGLKRSTAEVSGLHFVAAPGVEGPEARDTVAAVPSSDPAGPPVVPSHIKTAMKPHVPDKNYSGPDQAGVFLGEVWARDSSSPTGWRAKRDSSTFFPAAWDTGKVLDTIETALATRRQVSPGHFEADVHVDPANPSSPLIRVHMVINKNGELESAYPIQGAATSLVPGINPLNFVGWKTVSGETEPTASDLTTRDPDASAIARIFSTGLVSRNGTWTAEGLSASAPGSGVQLQRPGTPDPSPAAYPGKTAVMRPFPPGQTGGFTDRETPYYADVWSRQPTDNTWVPSRSPRSMFPMSWSAPKVIDLINRARIDGTLSGDRISWRDPASGITIIVEVDTQTGLIVDAYPRV